MKPYTVELWIPIPTERSHRIGVVRHFHRREPAERWARKVLGKVQLTKYQHRPRHVDDRGCEIRKRGRTIAVIEPEAILVPSVGELGYW